jgi:putative ABC transport system permease protein
MNKSLHTFPRLAYWILSLLVGKEKAGQLRADFEEVYRIEAGESGKSPSRVWYWGQFFKSLGPILIRRFWVGTAMMKNTMRIALRSMKRQKVYASINIAGLAVGTACCLLILLWVQDELSYDRFHENADRIVRVTRLWENADGAVSVHLGHVAPPIGPLLQNDFPEVERAVRMLQVDECLLENGDRRFKENRFFFVDEGFFDLFTFEVIHGDAPSALRDPGTIVITDETAEKYFGTENAVGRTLHFERAGLQADLVITGIIRAMPRNSHFHADFLASFRSFVVAAGEQAVQNWENNNFATYLLLSHKSGIGRLESQLDDFIKRHYALGESERTRLSLQRLTDIHLHSHLDSEIEPNGNMADVIVFSLIAFFVLFIACINFMNLATARSMNRAKEVGVRKVMGARRNQLIRQFLGESVVMAAMALVLAVLLVHLFLPSFNRLIAKELSFNLIQDRNILLALLGIAVFVGIISGSYPAFFLSSFRPVRVFRGSHGVGRKSVSLRTCLVVFQFSISIVLIASVGIVNRQLRYIHDQELGFDKEHVVVLPSGPTITGQLEAVKERLLRHVNIVSVSAAKQVPSDRLLDFAPARVLGGDREGPVEFMIAQLRVDHDYIPTFGMEMAAGRNFSKRIPTDLAQAFILNETAVRRIGWPSPQQAVDQEFGYGTLQGRIIGVVKDFHFESFHQQIAPLVLLLFRSSLDQVSVRIRPDDIPSTLAFLEQVWKEIRPGFPFSYFFVDDRFDQLYRSEEKLRQIFGLFAFLAVFVACLGLFGLASFTAEQRTREIGIRKTLGATVPRIVALLVSTFLKWVLIANFVALPITWIVMHRWLEGFAYRISIGWVVFVQSAVLAVIIAFITVGVQSVRAAMANPVDSLKYE